MGDTKAKRDLRAELSETADRADELFLSWGHASLKKVIKSLDDMQAVLTGGELWTPQDDQSRLDAIIHDIRKEHDKVKKRLSEKGRTETKIESMMADLPPMGNTEDSQRKWLAFAKRLAYAVQRLESHVTRKNPHPFILSTEYHNLFWERMRKDGIDDREIDEFYKEKVHAFQIKYEKDERPQRSKEEQAWLKEEDTLYRLRRKLNRKIKRKENRKTKARKAGPKQPAGHHTPKREEHKPHPGPGPQAGRQIPAFPERRAAQPIVPYERARVASRLPAFPAFPKPRRA